MQEGTASLVRSFHALTFSQPAHWNTVGDSSYSNTCGLTNDFACRLTSPETMVIVSYMIRRDYLVVGAGIGGASACVGILKYDQGGSVTLVRAEAFPPYKRWSISKGFLREMEANPKKLQEFDERWFEAHMIEARFGSVVTQFNIE